MKVYVPGPTSLWIDPLRNNGSENPPPLKPLLLGYGEHGVSIDIEPVMDPVHADIGGKRIPTDEMFMGETATVKAMLTVLNWEVLELAMKRPFSKAAAGGTNGTFGYGDVGTLMVAEGATYNLYIRFPYSQVPDAHVPAFFGGVIDGYRFLHAYLASGPIEASGTAAKIPATFRCLRKRKRSGSGLIGGQTGASAGAGGGGDSDSLGEWEFYDYDMTGTSPTPSGDTPS